MRGECSPTALPVLKILMTIHYDARALVYISSSPCLQFATINMSKVQATAVIQQYLSMKYLLAKLKKLGKRLARSALLPSVPEMHYICAKREFLGDTMTTMQVSRLRFEPCASAFRSCNTGMAMACAGHSWMPRRKSK